MSGSWMGASGRSGIDVMQVCLNGHKITAAAKHQPGTTQAFCSQCGQETIMACPECNAEIPGMIWNTSGAPIRRLTPPKYCHACGSAYPWQQRAIANAIEVLELHDVDKTDIDIMRAAMPDLIADTPRSEIAALHLKRILAKMGKPAYDITIKVMADLASEVVKRQLGLKP